MVYASSQSTANEQIVTDATSLPPSKFKCFSVQKYGTHG